MMGAIAPNLLNKTTTHYVATGLFFLFGLRSVYDQTVGYDANAESELEEVEKELKVEQQRHVLPCATLPVPAKHDRLDHAEQRRQRLWQYQG